MAAAGQDTSVFVPHSEGYSKLSQIQQNFLQFVTPCVSAAARSLNENREDASFVVVDYGAADGLNSVPLIAACSGELSSKVSEFEWLFNDLYNSDNIDKVKARLNELPGLREGSVKLQYVVGSFYKQVVPDKSVDLGVSFSAVHWLSQRPPVGSCTNPNDPDEATKALSARDWVDFLGYRAKELKPGGRLLIALATTGHGLDEGWTKKDPPILLVNVLQVMKKMFNEEIITEEEYESAQVFPLVCRTEADVRAPFLDPESDVSQSLRLVDIKTFGDVSCPLYNKWMKAGGRQNSSATEEHVSVHVNMAKSVCNSFWKILEVTRSEGEHLGILEDFYRRVEDMVRQNLEQYCVYGAVSLLNVIQV